MGKAHTHLKKFLIDFWGKWGEGKHPYLIICPIIQHPSSIIIGMLKIVCKKKHTILVEREVKIKLKFSY